MLDDLVAAVLVVPVNGPTEECVEELLKKPDEFGNQIKFNRGVLQPSKIYKATEEGGVFGETIRTLLAVQDDKFNAAFVESRPMIALNYSNKISNPDDLKLVHVDIMNGADTHKIIMNKTGLAFFREGIKLVARPGPGKALLCKASVLTDKLGISHSHSLPFDHSASMSRTITGFMLDEDFTELRDRYPLQHGDLDSTNDSHNIMSTMTLNPGLFTAPPRDGML